MKRLTSLLLMLSGVGLTALAQMTPGPYVIRNVQVLTMVDGDRLTGPYDVVIENGKIEMLAAPNQFKDRSFAEIDGRGKYLMPGISEMHAHIPVASDGDDTYVHETLFLYLSNGITTIRGMLGQPYHLELRAQARDNQILSPRIYTSSPSLNGNSVQSAQEARDKVQQYADDGYDFLKIHPGIKLEVMEELVRTADEEEIRFAGHVPADVGLERAIEYRYWSIDHCDGFVEATATESYSSDQIGFFGSGLIDIADPSGLDALSEKMADADVALVPTQSLFTRWISPVPVAEYMSQTEMSYMPASTRYTWTTSKTNMISSESYDKKEYYEFLEMRNEILRSAHRKGVMFLLGSDAPQVMNVPGFSIQHEMRSLADAGIPIYDILISGTVNPAKFFGQEGEYGQVTTGAAADLILLGANPLEDIDNMRKIHGVMARGHWIAKDEIDARLASIAARHAND